MALGPQMQIKKVYVVPRDKSGDNDNGYLLGCQQTQLFLILKALSVAYYVVLLEEGGKAVPSTAATERQRPTTECSVVSIWPLPRHSLGGRAILRVMKGRTRTNGRRASRDLGKVMGGQRTCDDCW